MARRVRIVGLLGVGLIAIVTILGVEVQAHYIPTSAGWVFHSVECRASYRGVPSTDPNPAEGECVVVTRVVDVLCQGPQGQIVTGTASHHRVEISGEALVDQNLQGKGKANVAIVLPEEDLLAALQRSGACNKQWTVGDAIIRTMATELNVYECVGADPDPCSDRELASTVKAECTLDSQFTFENPPDEGTPYDCVLTAVEHVS